MDINFFDNPADAPRAREDVKLSSLGLFAHEDGRRVAVGFEITPFIERPSIEVIAWNANGKRAGLLTVIQTLEHSFHLVMHLRDADPTDEYTFEATLYYSSPEGERMDVDSRRAVLDVSVPGNEVRV